MESFVRGRAVPHGAGGRRMAGIAMARSTALDKVVDGPIQRASGR